MTELGLASLFPMEDIAHHGITAVIANAPRILSRMGEAARAVAAAEPDVLVIIDCPGFNLGVARRVRRRKPSIPIVEYVSPTVWVWRPGRARWISGFVDQILAILPFEPNVHVRLGGPACTYVGHPLIERLEILRPKAGERRDLAAVERPTLLVLPGSRATEIRRLTRPFGEAIAKVAERAGALEVLLPAVPRFAAELRQRTADWPVKPRIVEGEAEKFAAFRRAHAALAASGTVTLELALAGVPMVVAYRVDTLVKPFKWVLSRINSFVLPNLILGTNEIPEFLDDASSPDRLAGGALAAPQRDARARPSGRSLPTPRRVDDPRRGDPERPRRRHRARARRCRPAEPIADRGEIAAAWNEIAADRWVISGQRIAEEELS